jgi:hypothetical protein
VSLQLSVRASFWNVAKIRNCFGHCRYRAAASSG